MSVCERKEGKEGGRREGRRKGGKRGREGRGGEGEIANREGEVEDPGTKSNIGKVLLETIRYTGG